ncbi:hypothetical protein GWI72_05810 [Microvirga tunisiensis]|uniref:Uncharacterized protein n=2 Tax=Pannonibacter tanglangensis TaxID=2750084 RepID=A0A7X5F105_9HYPH|nr:MULTISPECIES: hypothetical protein [unclassified Pannonibacter]NBN62112.1 hypothetical protein [Pannonibacter sp. XCT-34]NBN77782.1 hypothetical protein [Pannonibacter sp. XCT-53]
MKVLLSLFLALVVTAPPQATAELSTQEEFHIISRDKMNRFRGSHQLLRRPQDGFVQVLYCDQVYWVRPQTVAWTEREAERGFGLAIETNRGNGWRPVCQDPQAQVTLKDLNLSPREERAVTTAPGARQFRFQEIQRGFDNR